MNEPPFATTPAAMRPANTTIPWRRWIKRFLVCNPFYLCSAAVFLFGINRLSIDPNFLADETANLIFNFSALQLYEWLVVATAILLARRRIWYDSALLVVIDCGLVLVPFFLISHGVVTARGLGLALAAMALAFAASRYAGIRRFYSTFNLPARALVLGTGVLLINAVLPFTFWPWVKADMERWLIPNQILWYALLPMLVSAAMLLPKPARYGGSSQERHWLPLFVYGMWMAGTAVHVWCVAYLCDIQFRYHFIAPALLAAAWMARIRVTDFAQHPGGALKIALLLATFLPPLLAATKPLLFGSLLGANLIAYSVALTRTTGPERRVLKELMLATIIVLIAAAVVSMAPSAYPPLSRAQAFSTTVAICTCGYALRLGRPVPGIVAAIVIFVVASLGWRSLPGFVPIHAALMFLLLQSLSWKNALPAFAALRVGAAAIWILNAMAWVQGDVFGVRLAITGEGIFVLGICITVRLVYRTWSTAVVPVSGALVICLYPSTALLRHGSPGVIALMVSTLLFAIGTGLAWSRNRSQLPDSTDVAAGEQMS